MLIKKIRMFWFFYYFFRILLFIMEHVSSVSKVHFRLIIYQLGM